MSDTTLEHFKQYKTKGKLTLFLGMAAGVGKTYAMLKSARALKEAGDDIVIGWVENHGRLETEELTFGLESIPPKAYEHRGKELFEPDVVTIIRRKPKIVLIDELAHTNAEGTMHPKRYSDVEDILNAGIDVFTTMNIQHIESLNDLVFESTGVRVTETVPDKLLEKADEVQLIDIPPQKLIERLQEGKIYQNDKIEQALTRFFTISNLTALREIALKKTALKVKQEIDALDKGQGGLVSAALERVMVCIRHEAFSTKIIRVGKRLAEAMDAEWITVYIDEPNTSLSHSEKARLIKNLELAEELGSDIVTAMSNDVAAELLSIASKRGATHLVIGRKKRNLLDRILKPSFTAKLLKGGDNITIHIVPETLHEKDDSSYDSTATKTNWQPKLRPKELAVSLSLLSLVTLGSFILKEKLELLNIALLYLLPILYAATRYSLYETMATAFVGVCLFDFMFVPPVYSITVSDIRYVWSFAILFLVGYIVNSQSEKLSLQAAQLFDKQKRTNKLYNFSRKIAKAKDANSVCKIAVSTIAREFNCETIILLESSGKLLVDSSFDPKYREKELRNGFDSRQFRPGTELYDSTESMASSWTFEKIEVTGRGTLTLPGSQFLYLPIASSGKALGVFGIKIKNERIEPTEKLFIESMAGVIAVALDRIRLVEEAKNTGLMVQSEKFKNTLLGSVSHELKTPLSQITGASSALLEHFDRLSHEDKMVLLETIDAGAKRMNRLVANMIDTVRLQSDSIKLQLGWCDIKDCIEDVLKEIGAKDEQIALQFASHDELEIFTDESLLRIVLTNIFENAFRYKPENSLLSASLEEQTSEVVLRVCNKAELQKKELERIFEKFYRGTNANVAAGTGLGLFNARSIAQVLDAKLSATLDKGQFCMILALPKKELPKFISDEADE